MLQVSTNRLVCALLLLLSMWVPCWADAGGTAHKGVTASTVVNAPKAEVWKALTTVGNFDDKLIETKSSTEAIVEQKFKSLPMLSAIVIVVKAKVTPEERIDFDMVKCDRLKAFTGGYVLSEVDSKHTRVALTMYVDPGLPVPRFLVNKFIEGKVRSRLRRVKNLVEKT
jgi:hypothetical protein